MMTPLEILIALVWLLVWIWIGCKLATWQLAHKRKRQG